VQHWFKRRSTRGKETYDDDDDDDDDAWGRVVVCTGFWLGGLKGRDHWEDLGVGGSK